KTRLTIDFTDHWADSVTPAPHLCVHGGHATPKTACIGLYGTQRDGSMGLYGVGKQPSDRVRGDPRTPLNRARPMAYSYS
ncbi:MAG: hypothetical protein L7S45_00815, partial [Luminiphilus sp.]|nr:hypothetical protein [Luminiphilus sp.]